MGQIDPRHYPEAKAPLVPEVRTSSRVMFTGPCGVFEYGTCCEWLCAAVGAGRLVDLT
jgi:hypothetical protein